MTVRIAQVSDAHLSERRPFFAANFARVADAIRASAPDLVLATGDLSLAGADADSDAELAHALAEHARIGPELACVPGNHDVGNEPALGRSVATPERVARWRRVAGPSAWVRDLPGWRLIGWDCQGVDLDEGAWETIERGLRDAGGRSVALVQHKPLLVEHPDETGAGYWALMQGTRARLRALLAAVRPAVSISGHVHQWRDRTLDGTRHVWAPSTAFILGDAYQPAFGAKLIGWVEHAFHADGSHDARLRTVDGARLDDLGEMPQVYRPLPRLDAQPDLWAVKS
jgi:Icc protein